jgi:hypothetical protein
MVGNVSIFYRVVGFFKCLNLKHSNAIAKCFASLLCLWLVLAIPQSFALEYIDGEYRTQRADLNRLQELLGLAGKTMSAEQFREASLKFSNSQFSHTIRITVMKQHVLENSEFRRLFPEAARVLSQNPEASVRLSLAHDLAKSIDATKLANEGLSRSQGLNYRKLISGQEIPGKLTAAQAKELGELIRDKFINDVNVGEYRVLTDTFKEHSPNHEFTHIHSMMTAVEDWHDTAHFRTDVGKNLLSTVQWIEYMEKNEDTFKDTPKEDLDFMKRYAAFLDEQNFYKNNPELFREPANLGTHATPQEVKAAFMKRGEELVHKAVAQAKVTALPAPKIVSSASSGADSAGSSAKASSAPAVSPSSPAPSNVSTSLAATGSGVDGAAIKVAATNLVKFGSSFFQTAVGAVTGTVVVGGAIEAAKYAYRPEKSNLFDGVGSIVGAKDLGVCDSVECQKFMKECRQKLKLPDVATQAQIQSHDDFKVKCIDEFFVRSLDKQEQARQDTNLDRLLSNYAPSIRNLKCSSYSAATNKQEIIVQYNSKTEKDQFEVQKLIFNSSRKLDRVERVIPNSSTSDTLLCSNSNLQILQHCEKDSKLTCLPYDAETVRNKRLYNDAKNRKSLLWARKTDQMITAQSAQIHKCCANPYCHQFFSKRMEDYQRAADKKSNPGLDMRLGAR